jgi:hypothetical protein
MPSLFYNVRYLTIIFVKVFSKCVISRTKFLQKLMISLSEHCEWGICILVFKGNFYLKPLPWEKTVIIELGESQLWIATWASENNFQTRQPHPINYMFHLSTKNTTKSLLFVFLQPALDQFQSDSKNLHRSLSVCIAVL